jgi:hypothetical protein
VGQVVSTTPILARLIYTFNAQFDDAGAWTCSVDIETDDVAGFPGESASNTASGTSCTVTLLFLWNLATPLSDTITGGYEIGASGGANQSRGTSGTLPTIAVPNNGQTITEPAVSVVF